MPPLNTPPRQRVLGIDPGSRITGYGIVESHSGHIRLIASGVIKTDTKAVLSNRLLVIKTELERLIKQYNPNTASVESVFYSVNAKSALILGHARGAILVTVASMGLAIREFSPKEIKLASVGYGNADKQQVQRMIRLILNTKQAFKEDESDAIAAGICLINTRATLPPSHTGMA